MLNKTLNTNTKPNAFFFFLLGHFHECVYTVLIFYDTAMNNNIILTSCVIIIILLLILKKFAVFLRFHCRRHLN